MKVYAVGSNNKCIELYFKTEEDADLAFNSATTSPEGIGKITDMFGKKHFVNIFSGYSKQRSEIIYVLEKQT